MLLIFVKLRQIIELSKLMYVPFPNPGCKSQLQTPF